MPFSEMVSWIRAFAFIEPWAIDISHLRQRVFARYGGRLVGVGHDTELTLYRVSAANDTELAQQPFSHLYYMTKSCPQPLWQLHPAQMG